MFKISTRSAMATKKTIEPEANNKIFSLFVYILLFFLNAIQLIITEKHIRALSVLSFFVPVMFTFAICVEMLL